MQHFITKTSSKGRKQSPHIQVRKKYEITQTIVGWIACMSRFQSDAWCHQTKLKIQRYGQVTVILAANIIPIGVRYMKNKLFFLILS